MLPILERLVRQNGDSLKMYTIECELWLLQHGLCRGCPSELGCAKLMVLHRIYYCAQQQVLAKMRNPQEFIKFIEEIEEFQSMVLAAKTVSGMDRIDENLLAKGVHYQVTRYT